MRRILVSLLLPFLAVTLAGAAEPINIGETVTLPSEIMGEDRTLLISTPPGYEQGQQRYPVLYMTDGDGHFTHTRGTMDFLVQNGLMPPAILVGITNTDRTRDLTPTRAALTGRDGTPREFPTSGGSAVFLDFFEKELFPYVDSHYRTQPYRAFTGHSFGGLFALSALLTRPAMFHSVLAVGPSLQWDDDLTLRRASSFFEDRKELNATLVVAMANEERNDPRPTRLDRLEQTLEAADAEGFDWLVLRFPEETHGSVVLRAHYWGLRKIFEPWSLPADPETGAFAGGLKELQTHFAGLSKRYGFDAVPPENTVNQIGYQFLGRNDLDEAIAIFQYNVELYPDAPNVHDSLGEAFEEAGRLSEAFSSYSRAVNNAAGANDPRIEIFRTNRDRVKEQL